MYSVHTHTQITSMDRVNTTSLTATIVHQQSLGNLLNIVVNCSVDDYDIRMNIYLYLYLYTYFEQCVHTVQCSLYIYKHTNNQWEKRS